VQELGTIAPETLKSVVLAAKAPGAQAASRKARVVLSIGTRPWVLRKFLGESQTTLVVQLPRAVVKALKGAWE
jgi:hypothetical protein